MDGNANTSLLIGTKRHDGEMRVGNKTILDQVNHHGLVMETKFVNLSTHYVVVSFRDGCVSILPPTKEEYAMDAIVIGHTKRNYTAPIKVIQGNECDRTNMLRSQLTKSGNTKVYWEEVISLETLEKSRTGVYINSADVVLCLEERISVMDYHPFCVQGAHNKLLDPGVQFDPRSDVNVNITVVDNEGYCPRLYGIFHGSVVVLEAKKSNVMASGLYIAGLTSLDTERSNNVRQNAYYSLQDALEGKAPIKLFRTTIEAQTELSKTSGTDAKEAQLTREHDSFMALVKREKELLTIELEQVKRQREKENAEYEELEARRERKLQQEKYDSERRLHEYKEHAAAETTRTKSWTELAKVATVGLTFALTVYKLLG